MMLTIRVMGLPVLSCDCLCECLCEINQLPFLPALFIQRPFCPALFWTECRLKPRYLKKRVIKEHFTTHTISRGPLSTQHQSIFVVLTQTLFRYVRAPLWAKTQSCARVVHTNNREAISYRCIL